MRYHKMTAGEHPGTYVVTEPITEQDLLTMANQIARKRLAKGMAITDASHAAKYLQTLLQDKEHEVFAVLFLDNQHRLLVLEELFRGSVNTASVYPRELVKRALALNAAALILAHNHPSGHPEPSDADRLLTKNLIQALALIDVRVLDHLIVGAEGYESLAQRGEL